MGRDELFCGNGLALGKEPGQLRTAQLPQSIKRLHAGMRVNLDQTQPGLAFFMRRKPIEQLDQLELVQQVMLEPKNNVLVLAEIFQRAIASSKSRSKLVIISPAGLRDCLSTNVR